MKNKNFLSALIFSSVSIVSTIALSTSPAHADEWHDQCIKDVRRDDSSLSAGQLNGFCNCVEALGNPNDTRRIHDFAVHAPKSVKDCAANNNMTWN